MINYNSIFKEISNNILEFTKEIPKFLNEQDCIEINKVAQHINSHIFEKLQDMVPKIMLYGTYNSGKSTLINCFMGNETAKVSDKPETDKIVSYFWNGYEFFDTPGIDAPIEHEEISREKLSETEIVLFILSTDGVFEEKYIYHEIINIIKNKKPLIIILNNKSGLEETCNEVTNTLEKVTINLHKIAKEESINDIDEKVRILFVNAKTALKARLENKKILEEKSNILNVEREIFSMLKNSGSREVIVGLTAFVNEKIDKIMMYLDSKIKNPNIKEIQELKTFLEIKKSNVNINLPRSVEKDLLVYKAELRSLINSGCSEMELQNSINDRISKIENIINSSFEETINEIQKKVVDVQIEFSKQNLAAIDVKFNDTSLVTAQNNINSTSITESNLYASIKASTTNVSTLKESMLQLRNFKIPGFKGKWASTLGKWATKAAWVLTGIFAIYELYQASAEQNKINEEIKKRALEINGLVNEIYISLLESSTLMIKNYSNESFAKYENILDQMTETRDEYNNSKQNLVKIKNILSEINPV